MEPVELTDSQLIDFIQQLPAERKRRVLIALASDSVAAREERLTAAEEKMRALCARRGLDWDALGEREREAFVDDLIHEDRACAR